MLAGVAGGIADRIGLPDSYVRAGFVLLTAVWGLGLVLYLLLWLSTFEEVEDLEADPLPTERALGVALIFFSALALLWTLNLLPPIAFLVVVGALSFGVATLNVTGTMGPITALVDPKVEQPGRVRIVAGLALLLGGLLLLASSLGAVAEIGAVAVAAALTGVGLMVAFGPWVYRMARELSDERRERIRQEERAEVAAHLHDSVLQTLALIQRTDDPKRAAILARHQEGDLRRWLYGTSPLEGVDLVSTALEAAATRVEADHGVRIEVVTVGDSPLTSASRALISASTEAMVNAAKHAGADSISAFFEAGDDKLELWVTDQGKGFDVGLVDADRKGISESIVRRVRRVGGDVELESVPDEGTEVHMWVPA